MIQRVWLICSSLIPLLFTSMATVPLPVCCISRLTARTVSSFAPEARSRFRSVLSLAIRTWGLITVRASSARHCTDQVVSRCMKFTQMRIDRRLAEAPRKDRHRSPRSGPLAAQGQNDKQRVELARCRGGSSTSHGYQRIRLSLSTRSHNRPIL